MSTCVRQGELSTRLLFIYITIKKVLPIFLGQHHIKQSEIIVPLHGGVFHMLICYNRPLSALIVLMLCGIYKRVY